MTPRAALPVILALFIETPAHAAPPAIVKVGIFRTLSVQSAVLSSPGGLRVESSAASAHRVEPGQRVLIESSGQDVAVRLGRGAPVRARSAVVVSTGGVVSIQANRVSRELLGRLRFVSRSGALSIVNEVSIEDYVGGVLANEMPSDWPMEARKAQAVVIRSLALSRLGAHASEGFDLCDTTHCQVYRGVGFGSGAARAAARATAGQVVLWRGRPIEALYCSTCGGTTASGFGGKTASESPYLAARRDVLNNADACKDSPHYVWKASMASGRLARALQSDRRTSAGSPIRRVRVTSRDASGRAATVEIAAARTVEVDGYVFWTIVCRALGWGTVKSASFRVRKNADTYVFEGRGLGHGVGLCQWGAKKRAESGWSYRAILDFYYPGCRVGDAAGKKVRART